LLNGNLIEFYKPFALKHAIIDKHGLYIKKDCDFFHSYDNYPKVPNLSQIIFSTI